jgi:hypothetical protein
MSSKYQAQVDAFMTKVKASNPNETEFLQAVHEVAEAVIPYMEEHPKYKTAKILERTAATALNSTLLSDLTKVVFVSTQL